MWIAARCGTSRHDVEHRASGASSTARCGTSRKRVLIGKYMEHVGFGRAFAQMARRGFQTAGNAKKRQPGVIPVDVLSDFMKSF